MHQMDATVTAYEMCRGRSITYHSVSNSSFESFSAVVLELRRALDENALDDEWRSLLVALNRYRYDASHVPLPFDHPYLQSRLQMTSVRQTAELAEYTRPTLAGKVQRAMELLEGLVQSVSNPLQAQITSELQGPAAGGSVAIVLKHSRLTIPLRDFYPTTGSPDVDIVDPNALRRGNVWDRLFCIGAVRDFDDYIFSAPRSQNIEVIGYPWQSGRWQQKSSFLGGTPGANAIRHRFTESSQSQFESLSNIDLDRVQALLLQDDETNTVGGNYTGPLVEARLHELFGGKGVLLEASHRKTNMVINLDADREERVSQLSDKETEEGMFIVLRTDSSGGYIVPIADQLIGEAAARYRELLGLWKARLRVFENREGIQALVVRLAESGSKRVTPQNARNWMSTQTIAPDSLEDFRAIAILCGMESDFERMTQSAQQLRIAHSQAGQRVRRRLRELVVDADIGEVERQGFQRFEAPEFGGAQLTAYRVERRSEQIVSVAASSIERVFDLDVF